MIKKKVIIKGDKVTNVGYRPFLLAKALRLGMINFDAENVEDDDSNHRLVIFISGNKEQIDKFERFAKDKKPHAAVVSNVSVEECDQNIDIILIDEYRKILNSEQLSNIIQGGIQLRNETNQNFVHVDDKYRLISEGMFAVVNELKETNKTFGHSIEKIAIDNEERNKSFEDRIEKTEKNIERLLQILEKK